LVVAENEGERGGEERDRFFASFRSSLATEPKVSTLKEARVVRRSRGTPLVRSPSPSPSLSLSLSFSFSGDVQFLRNVQFLASQDKAM